MYPVRREHRGKGTGQKESLGAERRETKHRMKRSRGRQGGGDKSKEREELGEDGEWGASCPQTSLSP